VAAGIAILRYRLYEIDRLINRTLVYGLLSALLAGVYGGVVLILGQGFGGAGGVRRAGRWPAPPWPSRRCSSRLAGAFKRTPPVLLLLNRGWAEEYLCGGAGGRWDHRRLGYP
jgi:hypothetical protein